MSGGPRQIDAPVTASTPVVTGAPPEGSPPDLARLSLNQMTTWGLDLREVVEACLAEGVGQIGLWREKVAEPGVAEAARMVADAGLTVSSLCRGGFFPAPTGTERRARMDDNRRAVDEAAALGTGVLVLVCGGMVDRDLDRARGMVADGIAALAPYARERGVRLAIEPMHPVFAADRSVIVTLAQALDLAERIGEGVGVTVDTFHLWWDPDLWRQLARAGERILALQVCDWLSPMPAEPLHGRGLPGDGIVQVRRIREAAEAAGYRGPVEVEIFNRELWALPGREAVRAVRGSFLTHA